MRAPFLRFGLILLGWFVLALPGRAQVGIGILQPDSSAILHLESDSSGLLLPRLTTAQRDSINGQREGLMIYNKTDSVVQYWNGDCWLPAYLEDCDACRFNLALSDTGGTIDHINTDSVSFSVNLTQTNGAPQDIAINLFGNLPQGLSVDVSGNPVFSSGSAQITLRATPFTKADTFPIVVQAFCGNHVESQVYVLVIEPCYLLTVNNSTQNYDVATDLYATHPSAPTSSPVCVQVDVNPGVFVTSPDASQPAMTEGSLPAGSVVGINNQGNIIAKGGDGGDFVDPPNNKTGNGEDGGTALSLSAKTALNNSGVIFGGGGGGASMAFGLTFTINLPFPLPDITFGFLVGGGGGGGTADGLGGSPPSGSFIGPVIYTSGTDATGGINAIAGEGGILATTQSISAGPATINLTPSAVGGDGGFYGFDGTQGSFALGLDITANVPVLGSISVFSSNFDLAGVANFVGVPIPQPGEAGNAVKRNGNSFNIPDANYNTSFLKGAVSN